MLRFITWILVAPSVQLAALLTAGSDVQDAWQRGVIGRALVAMVEGNMALADGTESAGGTAAAVRRSTLVHWRTAFARRFGVPPPGPSLRAIWAHINIVAQLDARDDEPETAMAARRACAVLCLVGLSQETAPDPRMVHVERGWLGGKLLVDVRKACVALHAGGDATFGGTSEPTALAGVVDVLATCSQLSEGSAPLLAVCRLFERLRIELGAVSGRPLLDQASLELISVAASGGEDPAWCAIALLGGRLLDPPCQGHRRGGRHSLFRRSLSLVLWLGDGPAAGALAVVDHAASSIAEKAVKGDGALCLVCCLSEGAVARYHRSGLVNLASVVLLDGDRDRNVGDAAKFEEEVVVVAEEDNEATTKFVPAADAATLLGPGACIIARDSEAQQSSRLTSSNEAVRDDGSDDASLQAAARALGLIK